MPLLNTDFEEQVLKRYDLCMRLNLFITNNDLKNKYISLASGHNGNILYNTYYTSTFDILCPKIDKSRQYEDNNKEVVIDVNFQVFYSAQMIKLTNDNDNDEKIKIKRIPTGFFLKTDNSTKIINSTDGCFINGTFKLNDVVEKQSHGIPLIQVYSPTLCPILVEIADKYDDLM